MTARAYLAALSTDLRQPGRHPELHRLGRTLHNWFDPTLAWHETRATAGPTEGANNLIKATKRVGFGFRSFTPTASAPYSTPAPSTGT